MPFNIFNFFRLQHQFIGLNTLEMDSVYCAKIFQKLSPLFEAGRLKPFPINSDTVHGLDDAAKAYDAVNSSSPDRVVLQP